MTDLFRNRQFSIQLFFLLCSLVLIYKALELQVIDRSFRTKASISTIDKYTQYPSRGLIYDRNGESLVRNTRIYDLMVTYNQIDPDMDTAKFCRLLNIDKDYFEKALNKNWRSSQYSKSVPFVFLSKISVESFKKFEESLYEFPGFEGQLRFVRGYPHQQAAHLLGFIREVNQKEIKKEDSPYALGDYIGASGLELAYEDTLRGEKGAKYVLKDNLGKEVASYNEGKKDTAAISGEGLVTTIDFDLQAYGEELMQNKIGSIVAIDPKTGEILAMVSTPTYDPNLLTINRDRGKEYNRLKRDSLNPFFDRTVMAQYPPGSLFKPLVALIAMEEGMLNPNRTISCAGAYYLNGQRLMGCHGHPTCTSVKKAIQYSCNTYFATVFRDIIDQYGFYNPQRGLDTFNNYLDRFGIGRALGIDYPREKVGNYPSSSYYDKWYKGQKWNSVWIRSLGIGQGELLMTNLQMANLAAIIANKGHYYVPHLVKGFKEDGKEGIKTNIPEIFTVPNHVGVDSVHFNPVIEGMEWVVKGGTAAASQIWDIPFCGKTGTAENNQGNQEDHSIFFAFGPTDDPKIAIAVYVENGGFGSIYGAPIASLMIEKHVRGFIHPYRKYIEARMKKANLIERP